MFQKSPIDWKHQTESQLDACLAMKNNSSQWPAGKVLGGSSRINFNIHVRGHISTDYLSWQSEQDWTKEDVLYYFNKYEKADTYNRSPNIKQFFSHQPTHVTPIATAILKAANDLDFNTSFDMNNDGFHISRRDGGSFSLTPVSIRTGARLSAEHLYLKSRKKKNLTVLTNALVTKVLFKHNFEANGVMYNRFDQVYKVHALKSVVMSAGTLNTAKILLLSGIGPANQLKPLKIPVIADLSVGENLQDHIITGLDMITLEKSLDLTFKDFISPINIFKYFFKGTGTWTHPGCEAVGLLQLPSDKKNYSVSSPDLQFMLLPYGVSSDAGAAYFNHLNFKNEIWKEYFQPLVGKQVISLAPVLLHPQSRGYVKLDNNHEIVVQPNYLQKSHDVSVLVQGMKLVKKFAETKPLLKLGAMFNTKPFPGCKKYKFGSDNYWECYIRHMTLTSYHPVGTCKMGSIHNRSVVDHSLRVHKLNKLYVIDASIMPSMPSGNINAVVAMIAEKGADLIKKHCFQRTQKCKITDFFYYGNKY
ncbi:glucose dehydrogenase [FAD, quinone] isoform X2 [Acyrthosiphon pisum]|nr:glucose dehydrogenase [FAD, quinone] isoform X2 [Acyrthosiphon pisum]|eukprot:XP_016657101.1 PREDICTED: glucose dehydrogenase [FAD, quinone] isoform X2 [Acyrthosiphon pisum]